MKSRRKEWTEFVQWMERTYNDDDDDEDEEDDMMMMMMMMREGWKVDRYVSTCHEQTFGGGSFTYNLKEVDDRDTQDRKYTPV